MHLTMAVVPSEHCVKFMWKDRFDNFHDVKDMSTTHLFYTLRMAWNHAVPEYMQVGENIQRYRFSLWYTKVYWQQAIYYIYTELMARTDLPENLQQQLNQMRKHFKENQDVLIGK